MIYLNALGAITQTKPVEHFSKGVQENPKAFRVNSNIKWLKMEESRGNDVEEHFFVSCPYIIVYHILE